MYLLYWKDTGTQKKKKRNDKLSYIALSTMSKLYGKNQTFLQTDSKITKPKIERCR